MGQGFSNARAIRNLWDDLDFRHCTCNAIPKDWNEEVPLVHF
jgi:hypothetical protein